MIAAHATDSLNVLLFDALNTPMIDQADMRDQMLDYLKTLPPGLPVAVFGLGNQLYMLQGFTTDPKMLAEAIETSQKMIHSSARLDNPASNEPTPKMSDFAEVAGESFSDPGLLEAVAAMRQFELQGQVAQTAQRVQYTMQALNLLGRYLSSLPGRKNLIWFSASFPLNYLPDSNNAQEFMAVADFQDDVRKTTDLLARSQVAVYPVDGRGLLNNEASDASQSERAAAAMAGSGARQTARTGPGLFHTPSGNAQTQAGTFEDSIRKFSIMTSAEHATMTEIAENTGGKAFFDTNDLKSAVEKAVSDGSNYYSFTYTPPDEKLDGTYRRIEVKINQPDLHLSYRKTYFADNPNEAWNGKKVMPQSAMQAAMMFGAPGATQILFSVQAVPDDVPVNKLSQGSKPNSKLMKPPYRTYNLTSLVDIRDVRFSMTSDGVRHGNFEFAILVYDSDGEVVNQTSSRMSLDFPADRFAQILERGLRVGQTVEVPVKGDYFLRIGISDVAADHIGAVEFPVSSLKSKQAMTQDAAKNPASDSAPR